MFTGLVEQVGKVESVEDRRGQRRIQIQTKWSDLKAGESISVSGVCLTVAEASARGEAFFFVSEESLDRSTLGNLQMGSRVNLERALQFGGRMGGHWVQGHVDAKGLVLNSIQGSDHHRITVALDPKYGKYCVEKGSIAIDGISLTINRLHDQPGTGSRIELMIIPHTWEHTTLADRRTGELSGAQVDVARATRERALGESQRRRPERAGEDDVRAGLDESAMQFDDLVRCLEQPLLRGQARLHAHRLVVRPRRPVGDHEDVLPG